MRLYYFSTYFSADSAKGGKSEYLEKDFQSHSLGFVLNLVLTAPALCAGLA